MMEDIIVSTNHTSSSDEEESSWNFYLDNFDDCDDYSFSSGYVSNAAASAMNKQAHPYDIVDDDDDHCRTPFHETIVKRKRRRTKAVFVDHDLEDTATSPDHTPKQLSINNFNPFYLNSHLSQEQNMLQELHKQQEDGVCVRVSDQGEGDRSYTDLRRKGLFLVPVSVLLNSTLY